MLVNPYTTVCYLCLCKAIWEPVEILCCQLLGIWMGPTLCTRGLMCIRGPILAGPSRTCKVRNKAEILTCGEKCKLMRLKLQRGNGEYLRGGPWKFTHTKERPCPLTPLVPGPPLPGYYKRTSCVVLCVCVTCNLVVYWSCEYQWRNHTTRTWRYIPRRFNSIKDKCQLFLKVKLL